MKRSRIVELSPSMGAAIVNHLKAIGPLPESGYLAGQSVSSALFDLFADDHEGLVVYNDLDVFRPADDSDYDAVRKAARTLDTVSFQSVQVLAESHQLYLAVSKAYDVVRSYRNGLVNTVAYDNLYREQEYNELGALLRGFDLNCTQAGVDLATGNLVWTPAFAEFVKTRQLLVSNVQTPNHTAMRWFKKRHELPGCYGRDDESMELINLVAHAKSDDRRFIEKEHLRWRFGDKNANLYQQFRRELSAYFNLEQDEQGFYLLNPTQTPDAQWLKLASAYPMRAFPQVFNSMRAPLKQAQKARIHHIYFKGCGTRAAVSMTVGSLFEQGDAYVRHIQVPSQVDQIDEFLDKWPFLSNEFRHGTAAQQLELTRAWLAAERRQGLGFREFAGWRSQQGYCLSPDECEQDFNNVAAHHVHPDQPLIDRARLEVQIESFHVRELLTRRELLEEGMAMSHCVGGYAAAVYSGTSRILSVRHEDLSLWSTIEFRQVHDGPGAWEIRQHCAHGNRRPDEYAEEVVEPILLDLLNGVLPPLGSAGSVLIDPVAALEETKATIRRAQESARAQATLDEPQCEEVRQDVAKETTNVAPPVAGPKQGISESSISKVLASALRVFARIGKPFIHRR